MTKDLHLALGSAYEKGISLPSTAAVKEAFMSARQKGLGDFDFSAIYPRLSNIKYPKAFGFESGGEKSP